MNNFISFKNKYFIKMNNFPPLYLIICLITLNSCTSLKIFSPHTDNHYYTNKEILKDSKPVLSGTKLDYKDLFNGTDLSGWIVYGTEKWYVVDGLLVCESGPDAKYGYLGTENYYDNFILDLEFKQESNGNSGVFFRSTIDGIIIKGWQVEVAPAGHPLDKTGGIYESYGRGWLIKPDSKYDSVVKDNEWNKMRIKVFNDQVTTWVNGTQMINLKDSIISKGKGGIALQIHDGGGIKVKWKNIKIHEFKKPDIDINF